MTNLHEILNQYQSGERGLPDFRECCEIASQIDDYQQAASNAIALLISLRDTHAELSLRFKELATGEHDEQRNAVRDVFERDCT